MMTIDIKDFDFEKGEKEKFLKIKTRLLEKFLNAMHSIALILVISYCITALICVLINKEIPQGLTAIVSSVIGFYFGGKLSEKLLN